MTATDRTAYPRLDERMSRAELAVNFTLSESEHAFVAAQARGNVNRLAFAILMKARQAYGLFVNPDALSETIVAHMAKQLALPVPSLVVTSRLGLHRYRSKRDHTRALNAQTNVGDVPRESVQMSRSV